MRRALRLAARGQGRVEPNPMVGCVVVRNGVVVAQGWHQRFGGPHAEIMALRACARKLINPAACDFYVTLEPCCHHGKTPPCTDALIQARPRRIHVAVIDPFPQVAGRGIAALRRAEIPVHVGLCESEARQLNAPFIKRVATGLPWIIAKWAQTLDGRIATRSGDSKWISGSESRRYVHGLRARVDAIMVGIGTVLADDPWLTAREVPIQRHARRVVIDPNLRLPLDSQLLRSLKAANAPPLTVAVRSALLRARPRKLRQLESQGVEFVGLPALRKGGSTLALTPLLRHLAQAHSATNVLVEGGSRLLGSLLSQHFVDQFLVFVAPTLLGDAQAVPCVSGLSVPALRNATRLTLHCSRRFGDDLLLDYRPAQMPH